MSATPERDNAFAYDTAKADPSILSQGETAEAMLGAIDAGDLLMVSALMRSPVWDEAGPYG